MILLIFGSSSSSTTPLTLSLYSHYLGNYTCLNMAYKCPLSTVEIAIVITILYVVISVPIANILLSHVRKRFPRLKLDGCLCCLCVVGCELLALLWPLGLLYLIILLIFSLLFEIWSFYLKSCTEARRSCCFISFPDAEAAISCSGDVQPPGPYGQGNRQNWQQDEDLRNTFGPTQDTASKAFLKGIIVTQQPVPQQPLPTYIRDRIICYTEKSEYPSQEMLKDHD